MIQQSGWSNRLLCLKADQKKTAQQFVILTEWILQLWKVFTLQSCLLVRTCETHLCPRTSEKFVRNHVRVRGLRASPHLSVDVERGKHELACSSGVSVRLFFLPPSGKNSMQRLFVISFYH